MKDMRPAFARPASTFGPLDARILCEQEGMSYREWAAAHALAALMVGEGDWDENYIAKLAVSATDALIAELDREGEDA